MKAVSVDEVRRQFIRIMRDQLEGAPAEHQRDVMKKFMAALDKHTFQAPEPRPREVQPTPPVRKLSVSD